MGQIQSPPPSLHENLGPFHSAQIGWKRPTLTARQVARPPVENVDVVDVPPWRTVSCVHPPGEFGEIGEVSPAVALPAAQGQAAARW